MGRSLSRGKSQSVKDYGEGMRVEAMQYYVFWKYLKRQQLCAPLA